MSGSPQTCKNTEQEDAEDLPSCSKSPQGFVKTCGFIMCVRCFSVQIYMFTTFPNGQVYGCAIIRAVLHLFYEDLGVGSPLVGTHQDLSFEACFQFLRIYAFLLAHMYSTNRLEFGEVTVVRMPRGLDELSRQSTRPFLHCWIRSASDSTQHADLGCIVAWAQRATAHSMCIAENVTRFPLSGCSPISMDHCIGLIHPHPSSR